MQLDVNDPTRVRKIGSMLPVELKEALKEFLRENSNVFASIHDDMPGIDLEVIVNHLNVNLKFCPVK